MRRRAVVPEARTRRDPDRQENYERDQLQGQQGLLRAVAGFLQAGGRPPGQTQHHNKHRHRKDRRERRGSPGDDMCRQNHQITADVRGEHPPSPRKLMASTEPAMTLSTTGSSLVPNELSMEMWLSCC